MNSSFFHETLAAKQATCLAEIRPLRQDDFPDYLKNWFLNSAKQAGVSEREMRLVIVIVSAISSSLHHRIVPKCSLEKKQTHWHEIPMVWRVLYASIIILLTFLFSLIGALLNPILAGLLSVVGIIAGLVITRLWAKDKFGLEKEMAFKSSSNYLPIDAEESYNQMMILADTLDSVLEIHKHEEEGQNNSGLYLTTDILVSIQKLIGSSKRGDEPQVIRDYIENLEDILPHAGIQVIHYPEGGEDAFIIVSGKLHGVEILPALSANNDIIIPGKYMK